MLSQLYAFRMLWIILYVFKNDLGIHDFLLTWLSIFWQLERHFFKHLFNCAQQISLVASTALWPSSNFYGRSSQIRQRSTFICAAFKSHMVWSNVLRVSDPTIKILTTSAGIYHSLNFYVIYSPQTRTYENIANFWLTLVILMYKSTRDSKQMI